MSDKFEINDEVICIKKPTHGTYQCNIGDIFTIIKTTYGYASDKFIWTKEDEEKGNGRCYSEGCFELHIEIEEPKYNPDEGWNF